MSFTTRSKKEEGGVKQLINTGPKMRVFKTGVFLSGCLNRLLTVGPIRGCCVPVAVSSQSRSARVKYLTHSQIYARFCTDTFFHIFFGKCIYYFLYEVSSRKY